MPSAPLLFSGIILSKNVRKIYQLQFAKANFPIGFLWAIELNTAAIRFYERHGFRASGEKKFEDGTDKYLIKMVI